MTMILIYIYIYIYIYNDEPAKSSNKTMTMTTKTPTTIKTGSIRSGGEGGVLMARARSRPLLPKIARGELRSPDELVTTERVARRQQTELIRRKVHLKVLG